MPEHDDHIDGGLGHDLPRVLTRRRALGGLIGGAGLALLTACGSGSGSGTATATGPGGAPPGGGASNVTVGAGEIPEETAGPFPADGSHGANVLTESGIVRRDIRSSFAGATGVAEGVPLTLVLRLVDVSQNSTPLAGAAVYLWHCDRDGNYSLYSPGVTGENYLRGVQVTGSDGSVTFESIYPAAYPGRWPHVHFEVYESLAKATTAGTKMRTTQLALPKAVCETVYASSGYEQSRSNLTQLSLERDNVFSDGYSLQLAKVTGSVSSGYTATLTVPV